MEGSCASAWVGIGGKVCLLGDSADTHATICSSRIPASYERSRMSVGLSGCQFVLALGSFLTFPL